MSHNDEIFSGEARDVGDRLVHAAPPVAPPAGLKARLMERVRGCRVNYSAVAEWAESGVPGVTVRVLSRDEASDRQTVLVRMEAGSEYPCHRHAGYEECYVVEGDLEDGDLRMGPGDYSRFEGGTVHGPLRSRTGCLLLVTSSLHDEAA